MPRYDQFTEADWVRLERDWSAWWAGELRRPLLFLALREAAPELNEAAYDDHLSQFGTDRPVAHIVAHMERLLNITHFLGDAFPKLWVNYGPGIMAGFVGGAVEHAPFTTWFHPLNVSGLADIHLRFDPANAWWCRVQEVTRATIARWGNQIVTGYTDIGGNLDILASLRGTQSLLLDLYDDPESVARLTSEITDLWLRYYDALHTLIAPVGRGTTPWAPIWSPGRCYMLQCDFSYMISPQMFERYVLPDLTTCCEAMEHGFYHLDGKGQLPHLDLLLSIPRLRGIQWQPGDGQPMADGWLDVLRRIRQGGKLCQVYVTRAGAYTIARALGGEGFLFEIQENITPEEGHAFVEAFRRDFGAP